MTGSKMTATILIVDDKLSVQKMLGDFLSNKGFDLLYASNGRDAQLVLKKHTADLILLDIMMPQMNGYQFLEKLREQSELPVIMITAKQQESDVVKGFTLGADDYITKPFSMSELLARINAVLKRSAVHYSGHSQLKVANLTLDNRNKELWVDSEVIEVTAAELCLLALLMQSVERTVSKADICMHLINEGYSGSESTLKIHVRNLRNKLYPVAQQDIEIESVFGVGYRLRKLKR